MSKFKNMFKNTRKAGTKKEPYIYTQFENETDGKAEQSI